MRKKIFQLTIILLAGSFVMLSCGAKQSKVQEEGEKIQEKVQVKTHEAHEHTAGYRCTMRCEGDKTYDKEGNCPACGMALSVVESSD